MPQAGIVCVGVRRTKVRRVNFTLRSDQMLETGRVRKRFVTHFHASEELHDCRVLVPGSSEDRAIGTLS
jgi:hypothetical protein